MKLQSGRDLVLPLVDFFEVNTSKNFNKKLNLIMMHLFLKKFKECMLSAIAPKYIYELMNLLTLYVTIMHIYFKTS